MTATSARPARRLERRSHPSRHQHRPYRDLRNARGVRHPDPLRAAKLAVEAGADNITAHLREDRRHIRDDDIERLCRRRSRAAQSRNGVTQEMLAIALATRRMPVASCPSGGGNYHRRRARCRSQTGTLAPFVAALRRGGIQVRFSSIPISSRSKPRGSGSRCRRTPYRHLLHGGRRVRSCRAASLTPVDGAARPRSAGLECMPATVSTTTTSFPVASNPQIVELNIGHYLVGEALFVGSSRASRACAPSWTARGRPCGRTRPKPRPAERAMIIGIGNDMIDIRRVERTIERYGERFLDASSPVERQKSDGRACAPPPTPSASPPRRLAPRRSAPDFARGVLARYGGVNLPSGRPTLELTGGAALALARLTPEGTRCASTCPSPTISPLPRPSSSFQL